jgi:rare lipoprotein A
MRIWAPVSAALLLLACTPRAPQQEAAQPHYVIGRPYRIGAVWRYPREQFDAEETGLATVETRRDGVTADGEAVDAGAMAAAHPTLQLPAIARVTNLANGWQVVVRINDRGPPDPGRAIALTPRAMALLHPADPHAVPVRIEVLQADSLRLATELGGAEAPRLALAVVPVGEVTSQALPPPPGASAAPLRVAAATPPPRAALPDPPPVPLRLPVTATRVAAYPASLYVEIASFAHPDDAALLQRRLATLGARVALDPTASRERAYDVRVGPLAGAVAADATLARVIAQGFGDARIVAR